MRYVLNYWQPKDIPEVLEEFHKIKGVDKLIFKYMGYPRPHEELQKFVEKSEYDYIIIVTNDVVVKQENIDRLIKDIETNQYLVISGIMNVDMESDYWNASYEMGYDWIKQGSVEGIKKVAFAGFPLMAIHKSVYKRYNWYIPKFINNASDLRFCKWCQEQGIGVYVNFNNQMKHLRYHGELLVGKKEEKTEFINS